MKAAFASFVFLAALCISSGLSAEPAKPVRLKFAPEGEAWKGETPFKGASWTSLGPGLKKGTLWLSARAGIGDKFPVQQNDGVTLFEVLVLEGTDELLLVEVQSAQGSQNVELPRDKHADVEVSGTKYQLLFPTVSVGAAPDEKPTTNKATIFVTRQL